jgi:adenosylcobyric acid synthase
MVQGTTSDAGKSTLVAGLARLLARRGVRVAPFKPQNMALNSAVTVDGGEIGRAQALQAMAAGLAPHTDMNPVLLKPSSDTGAQVIIHGRAVANLSARAYHDYKPGAMAAVLESYGASPRLRPVLVEGAGSPAEINLRDRDIANMGFAEAVDCPVILVADIDRGGVFAHLVGTLELLSQRAGPREGLRDQPLPGRHRPAAIGLDWLSAPAARCWAALPARLSSTPRTPSAKPWQRRATARPACGGGAGVPRISNHTDLDALRLHPQVDFSWVGPGSDPAGRPHRAARLQGRPADLAWLRAQGWETAIRRHLRYGGKLIGICGGTRCWPPAARPSGWRVSPAASTASASSTPKPPSRPRSSWSSAALALPGNAAVAGYEIHMGVTRGPALAPVAHLADGRPDGALSADGQILGSYLHGLFDQPEALAALLAWAGLHDAATVDLTARREADLNRLADSLEAHLDLPASPPASAPAPPPTPDHRGRRPTAPAPL